jgi:hypothetical protein
LFTELKKTKVEEVIKQKFKKEAVGSINNPPEIAIVFGL